MSITYGSFVRFCVLTIISFSINFGLTAFLHEVIGVHERLSFAAALITVFIINYFMQRYYVYKAHTGDAKQQLFRYFFSSLGFRGFEYISFLIVFNYLSIHYLLAVVSVLFISFMIKFFYFGTYVFQSINTKTE